jgi:hypothetical protein
MSFECGACEKTFSNKGNLDRHVADTPVCKKWLAICPNKTNFFDSTTRKNHDVANMREWEDDRLTEASQSPTAQDTTNRVWTGNDILGMLLPNENRCAECGRQFSSVGCVNRHYKGSLVCDKMRAMRVMGYMVERPAQQQPASKNYSMPYECSQRRMLERVEGASPELCHLARAYAHFMR